MKKGKDKAKYPLLHRGNLIISILLLWGTLWPPPQMSSLRNCSGHCISLAPHSENDPDPPPHYDDLFPPGCTPFPNPNTHLHPSFNALPPVPSFPLDPPPSYDSLFATAVPPDSAEAPSYSPHIS